jgi:putative transposase
MSKCTKKDTKDDKAKNRGKKRAKLAKEHEKSANRRLDHAHKLARELTDNYDVVVIEDLDMRAMSRGLRFGKSVMDIGWGQFVTILTNKMQAAGKRVIKINRRYPSSKKCSACGNVKATLSLKERTYHCEKCGLELGRDHNAAINIKQEGLRILTMGHREFACYLSGL